MPRKARVTATATVLLRKPVSLDDVAGAVRRVRPIDGRIPAEHAWPFGGESLVVALDSHIGTHILIDVVPHPWPDDMGGPVREPRIFEAWGLGHFGPFTWPGSLTRARQLPWVDAEAAKRAGRHTAFIRFRAVPAANTSSADPILPPHYDPLGELYAVTELAGASKRLPDALCYFNPNGQSVALLDTVDAAVLRGKGGGTMPLDLWSSQRLFAWAEVPGWSLVDTVGVSQLDSYPFLPWCVDHEACFRTGRYAPDDVSLFLLNTAHLLVTTRQQVSDGTTTDGPGGIWRAQYHEESLESPPRNVLRWLPVDGSAPPAALTNDKIRQSARAGAHASWARNS